MTKTTENTDPGEVERLRNHNAELLAELKTAKAKVTALQGQITTATEERDASRAEVLTLRLDSPVRSMLEGIAAPGTADVLAQMIATRGYSFELDGEQIAIRDASGNPATVVDRGSRSAAASKPRAAKFDRSDLTLLLTEEGLPDAERHALSQTFQRFLVGTNASGGGSTGGAGSSAPTPPATPAPKPSAPKAFGLT